MITISRAVRSLVLGLGVAALLGGVAAQPARADEDWHHDRDWRAHEWREHEWREHERHEQERREWAKHHRYAYPAPGYYYPAPGYAYPPSVIYAPPAPPPVVYAPPAQLDIVVPVHIR